jgi:hypothetical protein
MARMTSAYAKKNRAGKSTRIQQVVVALERSYGARIMMACALIVLAALTLAALPSHAQTADPINGGITYIGTTKCAAGGVGNSTCYSLSAQCSGIDGSGVPAVALTLKVTNPGSSKGAIIFIETGGATTAYDQSFAYGELVVNSAVQAGFTAVQPYFAGNNGWLQGPAPNGPRAVACRYAALANWVYSGTSPLIHQGGTAMCATGVSAGSSVVAYSLSHFGLGSGSTRIFDMVEVASGPMFGRLDHGCICNQPPYQTTTGQGPLGECYLSAGSLVDSTYPGAYCSAGMKNHSTTYASLLYHDSVVSDDSPILNYTAVVRVVFGAQNDLGGAIPQGLDWASLITSPVTVLTVGDAAHLVPDTFDGAMQIANDLNTYCALQAPRK